MRKSRKLHAPFDPEVVWKCSCFQENTMRKRTVWPGIYLQYFRLKRHTFVGFWLSLFNKCVLAHMIKIPWFLTKMENSRKAELSSCHCFSSLWTTACWVEEMMFPFGQRHNFVSTMQLLLFYRKKWTARRLNNFFVHHVCKQKKGLVARKMIFKGLMHVKWFFGVAREVVFKNLSQGECFLEVWRTENGFWKLDARKLFFSGLSHRKWFWGTWCMENGF